ncbi:MAG: response regulator, partial [Deltaproteobacteria bacterium]|nr:response regulator [Deltaproteobacteria bacterium]
NIYLPRHMGTDVQEQKTVSTGAATTGHETILLVEDEKAILTMASMVLERLGYTVLTASAPSQAIRISESYSSRIDLLMTDVVMPEMNGRDLAEKLLHLYPNLKCLYMSGYTANAIAHHGVLDKGVHFIPKPFSKMDLATKLREVLEDTKTTDPQ